VKEIRNGLECEKVKDKMKKIQEEQRGEEIRRNE
jgi:hypothetical protein